MQIKTFIKQYLLLVGSILLLCILIREYKDNRPIKFENYNSENFLAAMRSKFPLGSNIDRAIEVLVESGTRLVRVIKVRNHIAEGTKLNAKYMITFEYYSPIISLNPNALYQLYFEIDRDRKIVKVSGSRIGYFNGFWMI